MTRDARKHWPARIALVALGVLIGLVGLIGLVNYTAKLRELAQPRPADVPDPADVTGPPVFHETGPVGPPAPTNPNASLVVTEFLHDQPEHRTRVVRYDFKNGQVQPPETLWEGPYRRFGIPDGLQPIIEGRYLVALSGSVIDLREKTLIHEGAGRLMEVRGDRVVSALLNDSRKVERLVAFNLRTRAIEKLTDREVEEFTLRCEATLPGERSPDGLKSVYVSDDKSLKLYRVGQRSKQLGRLEIDPYSSVAVWLDNEHFLTQDGNGQLIEVDLDGARVPVMQVPVEEKTARWSGFQRDTDGRIIYACGRERFVINTEAKTWERGAWVSHGHGFEESSLGDDQKRRVYRYKGTEILRSPFWTRLGHEALTTESYIAVKVESDLCVWFAGTGEWTTLGTHTHQIAGWIK
jgi:hypothetical protein